MSELAREAVAAWWDTLAPAMRERVAAHRDRALPADVVGAIVSSPALRAGGIVPADAVWSETRAGYAYFLPAAVEEFLAAADLS